tara:strand:+ start:201 stop:2090 length:1890 start_codon:yes stop_codon:yes gene_type:complete
VKPKKKYDIIICGGGHAGIEAALIASKLKQSVALVTLDIKAVGRMSCNPAIGGLAKGQIVREIDVLGGVMGLATDQSGIQFKILNQSKGKSVWSPRAQVDKRVYEKFVSRRVLENKNIDILQGEVVSLLESAAVVRGVYLRDGKLLYATSVILTCGTFLNGLIHVGQKKIRAGRMGESGAEGITENLVSLGFVTGRLKTGTPPRLDRSSVDWGKTSINNGDKSPLPFSYETTNFNPPHVPCHTIVTGVDCKNIIKENLSLSPMFSGDVGGVGPRYCPSIEDKIHRFAHHDSHTLFLEPEWMNSDQIYLNGFSTSLPEHVQLKALRTIPGMAAVKFFRPGYAIEYDFFSPAQLKSSLETKNISGLFFAGQINGTSGYEEAAAQGLIAGVNASKFVLNKEPLIIKRSEGYLGVMIDDLITKDTLEPYRMFTSRAEYRLLLRFSNAHSRLAQRAENHSLLGHERLKKINKASAVLNKILNSLEKSISPLKINEELKKLGENPVKQATPLKTILKRPSVSIKDLPLNVLGSGVEETTAKEALIEAEAIIKYEGYIKRQQIQIERMKRNESSHLPQNINYMKIKSISNEAKEKLSFVRPETFGQAMRVSGVTPADIAALSVLYLKRKVSRETSN